MREIKFRAWDKVTSKMYEVRWIQDGRWGIGYWNNIPWGILWRNSNQVEIMQFTGLKDSQGREIYEGDIISFPFYQGTIVLPIKWETGSWQAIGDGWEERLSDIVNTCKIIGNLYENPDLLKEEK